MFVELLRFFKLFFSRPLEEPLSNGFKVQAAQYIQTFERAAAKA